MSGRLVERALREPLRLVVHERARHQPRAAVRAGDELERRRARDRIDRKPHRARLRAVDVVVRLILVPRRALRRPRLLHEHVVVVEPHLARRPSTRRRSPPRASPRRPARARAAAASCRSPRRSGPGRPAGSRRARARSDRRGSARSPPRRARDPAPRTLRARRPRRHGGTPRRAPGSTTGDASIARVYVRGAAVSVARVEP